MSLILIIDDDHENIDFLKVYLQTLNIDTITAFTGKAGMELALEHQPDAIVTDLHMPTETWDGFQTITQLRAHHQTQLIPIIVVTALSIYDIATQSDCDEILHRPFRMHYFGDLINRYLETAV